MNKFPQTTN